MDKEVQMWLKRAKSSLIHSKAIKEDGLFYEDLCFSCQQSAEKALKSLVIHIGLKPPKTHSFEILIDIIRKRILVPENIYDVLDLSDYAVFTRYPDDYAPIDEEEYKRAVDIAEKVYNWVAENIE